MDSIPRARPILFALLTVVGLFVVLELFAYLGLAWVEGGWTRPRERAAERAALAGADATRVDADATDADPAPDPALVRLAVHPFFGFTRDPALADPFGREIGELGFFVPAPAPPADADVFAIGVFGGSVANHFAFHGRRRLAERLTRAPALAGRTIWVRSFAMGGYKQPQQANVLGYLLAAGERLDLAINLDGFNELVLPFDGLAAGVHPFYPIHWSRLAGGLPDLERQLLAGEIVYLESRRAAHATRFASPLRRRSGVGQLLWRLGDRRLAVRLAAARAALARPRVDDGRSFARFGPPVPRRDDDARLRQLTAFWQRASLQMHGAAGAMGMPYYHFLQPNQYLPGSKPLSAEERRRAYDDGARHRPLVERGYPLLIAAGAELRARGVAFHDLSRVFAGVEQPLYTDSCCHLGRAGNELLADAIAEILIADLDGVAEEGREDGGVR